MKVENKFLLSVLLYLIVLTVMIFSFVNRSKSANNYPSPSSIEEIQKECLHLVLITPEDFDGIALKQKCIDFQKGYDSLTVRSQEIYWFFINRDTTNVR